jgi:hypothetical protein
MFLIAEFTYVIILLAKGPKTYEIPKSRKLWSQVFWIMGLILYVHIIIWGNSVAIGSTICPCVQQATVQYHISFGRNERSKELGSCKAHVYIQICTYITAQESLFSPS